MNKSVNVVRLRQVEGSLLVPSKPKVWTEELIRALATLNSTVRWLREHDLTPLSINLDAPRPTIVVRPIAAGFLVTAAHGLNTNRQPNGECICSVVINDCSIQWRRPAPADAGSFKSHARTE